MARKPPPPPPPVPSQESAAEEHRIMLPGIDLAFNHETRTVFMVDQTGGNDLSALEALEKWFLKRGWYLHCVKVAVENEKPLTDQEPRLKETKT